MAYGSFAMIYMVHIILRNLLSNYGEGVVVVWQGVRAESADKAVAV